MQSEQKVNLIYTISHSSGIYRGDSIHSIRYHKIGLIAAHGDPERHYNESEKLQCLTVTAYMYVQEHVIICMRVCTSV